MKGSYRRCSKDRPTNRFRRPAALLLTCIMASATLVNPLIHPNKAYGASTNSASSNNPINAISLTSSINPAHASTDMKRTDPKTIAEWKIWAKEHASKLTSIQPEKQVNGTIPADKFTDLDMLKTLLANKRIVYLGESTHGAAEFNLVKTRLIQYLHQQLGYNIVAFESGLGDAAIAQGQMKSQTAEQTMRRSIFPVWWTEETLPLFDYMKNTQNSEQPLRVAGFDIQQMNPIFIDSSWLKDEDLKKKIMEVEQFIQQLVFMKKDLAGYQKSKPELLQRYKQLLKKVKNNEEELKQSYPNEPHIVKLLERAVEDRIEVIDEYNELLINGLVAIEKGDFSKMGEATQWRDKKMADNLTWLATEVFPEEKIIVWAHNSHISKAESEIPQYNNGVKWMGELMPKKLKQMSYVIGFFMASGESGDNGGRPVPVKPILSGSLEDILSASNVPYTFMDLKYHDKERGNSWMFEPVNAYSWGQETITIIPRRHYDGILLIDKVRLPRYLPYGKS